MNYAKINAAIAEMRELTAVNDHVGAYITGAEAIGAKVLLKKLESHEAKLLLAGELTEELAFERYELYNEFKEEAEARLDEETYERFYGAT